MQKKLLLFMILILPLGLFAQHQNESAKRRAAAAEKKEKDSTPKHSTYVGGTLSTNGDMSTLAIHGVRYFGIGKGQKKFKIGLGPRLTSSFAGPSTEYITAHARLTSGQTGPGVFFADQIPENIDTVFLNSTQINSLNLMLALRYDLNEKIGVEFNIDLAGISFGGKKNATMTYHDTTLRTHTSKASPTLPNVLLISDNDIGSLNSELMISYKFNDQLTFRGGAVFLFNEYKLDDPKFYNYAISSTATRYIDADRYRTKALMFGLGVQYQIFK